MGPCLAEDWAILTGDLRGSTAAGPGRVAATLDILRDCAAAFSAWTGTDARFTRFRGDGWQLRLAPAGLGLRAALTVAACLRADPAALATRISVGVGRVDDWGTRDLSDARGPALEASGRGLDAMGRLRWLAVGGAGLTALHDIVADLAAERATRWTAAQAEAMAHHLHPDAPTLDEVGRRLGISAQAAGFRLQGAGGATLRRALRQWEDAFDRWQATGSWGA